MKERAEGEKRERGERDKERKESVLHKYTRRLSVGTGARERKEPKGNRSQQHDTLRQVCSGFHKQRER